MNERQNKMAEVLRNQVDEMLVNAGFPMKHSYHELSWDELRDIVHHSQMVLSTKELLVDGLQEAIEIWEAIYEGDNLFKEPKTDQ